jgi:uncharacterized membrane protein YbaN (DUF454 family)
MQKKIKKILVLAIGSIFIILGLFGLVLPFLQGIVFLAIGIILISFSFPKIRLWVDKHAEPYPHVSSVIKKMETLVKKLIGEI